MHGRLGGAQSFNASNSWIDCQREMLSHIDRGSMTKGSSQECDRGCMIQNTRDVAHPRQDSFTFEEKYQLLACEQYGQWDINTPAFSSCTTKTESLSLPTGTRRAAEEIILQPRRRSRDHRLRQPLEHRRSDTIAASIHDLEELVNVPSISDCLSWRSLLVAARWSDYA